VEVGVEAARKDHDHAEANEVAAVGTHRGLKGRKGFRPYQYDPRITRPELVGAHTKWLICSSAFFELGEGQCETRQRYVPDGYWFETGRLMPNGTNCSALSGNGDIPTASCRFKKGLKMVLPVVNIYYYACDAQGVIEDPRLGPELLQRLVPGLKIRKATLDAKAIDPLDALNMILQDGDSDYTYPTVRDRCVQSSESGVDFPLLGGCPISAGGPYVFIDTKNLTKGAHELILIGEDTSNGFCSAVKHLFTLY
jgi:hypothetical protein